MDLLPTCPVVQEWGGHPGSHIVIRDYSRPSYRLSKQQLLAMLGKPAKTHAYSDDQTVEYAVFAEGSMRYYLMVDFRNGYAVDAETRGWNEAEE